MTYAITGLDAPNVPSVPAFLLAVLLASLPVAAGSQSVPAAAAERELLTAEAQLAAALSSVDVDQLARIWADEFVSTMADGHVTSGKRRLAALRAKKPEAGVLVISKNENVDVHAYGDWAVVLVTSSWVADGKKVGEPYQATHVWAKRDGVWSLVAAHISQVKSESSI
jgi:ketosteroid isomerase-like protein